jgi:hypothetical protein
LLLQVHDSCWPFDCFPPLKQQEQGSTGTSALPGLLTRAAQTELQAMVQQFQQATGLATGSSSSSSSSSSVSFVVHAGDALALCAAGSSLGDDTRFVAIDCSNLGDHVGEVTPQQQQQQHGNLYLLGSAPCLVLLFEPACPE